MTPYGQNAHLTHSGVNTTSLNNTAQWSIYKALINTPPPQILTLFTDSSSIIPGLLTINPETVVWVTSTPNCFGSLSPAPIPVLIRETDSFTVIDPVKVC